MKYSVSRENERIVEVDILRGIAIGLMILGHSFIVYPVNVYNIPWCTNISYVIYTFHMELLFIIAGYVYKCVDYKKYVYSKVQRILIPYIIFGSVSVLFKAFGGNAVNGNINIGGGVKSLVFEGGGIGFYMLFLLFI